jgi:hypothetical protein
MTLEILKSNIRSCRVLPHNWNGYNAITPPIEAIDGCLLLIDKLNLNTILPSSTLSGDGKVGLFWENNLMTIEVDCKNTDTYGYLVDTPLYSIEEENVSLQRILEIIPEKLQLFYTA